MVRKVKSRNAERERENERESGRSSPRLVKMREREREKIRTLLPDISQRYIFLRIFMKLELPLRKKHRIIIIIIIWKIKIM